MRILGLPEMFLRKLMIVCLKTLSHIIFNGPQETLTLTANAQPAIMCVSIAVMKVLEKEFKVSTKKHISFFAGHSLG